MTPPSRPPDGHSGPRPAPRSSVLDDRGRARFHRFFFALYPDPDTAERICRMAHHYRRRRGLDGRPMAPERLHLTLNPLHAGAALDERAAARALEAASGVNAPAFVVALDHVVSWRGAPRPLVLVGQDGVIGVEMLQAAIHIALRQAGLTRRPRRQIRPHVTLLRDQVETPTEFVDPVCWRALDFALVHSPHGESRHEVLGRWTLEPRMAPRR